MRVPTRPREHGLRFNITPLIDIVFLLIIFFLAASHFVRNENLEAVELPEATQRDDEEEERTRRLIVTVTADRKLHVGGEVLSMVELERRIGPAGDDERRLQEVRIRADRSVPFRVVEPIMIECARAGIRSVKFAVLEK